VSLETDQLNASHVKHDLRRRSVRGGAVTLASQGTKFLLTMGSTAILGRILLPSDFGLLGQVFAITGFVEIFRDMGLSAATIQRAELNQKQVSTLFWINAALGATMCLVACALAPGIAWFYGEPRLLEITMVLGITFVLSGLNVQHNALLKRNMRFKALATSDITSFAFGIVAAIVAANLLSAEHKYWALVVQQLGRAVVGTLMTWYQSGWRPGLPSRSSGVGSMLKFGGNQAGAESVIFLSRNMDNLLIGWKLGQGVLGLYMKAYQLLLLPIQQINRPISQVALPALSRLQNEPERYRNYYKKAIVWVVGMGMPVVTFMFVSAEDLILTVLGPNWGEAVPLFRVLAPAAFMGTFNVATGWVFVSTGQPGRQFRWSMFTSALTIAGYFVGLRWGAMGVAAAFSIVYCGVTMGPPGLIYCYRNSPVRLRDLFDALWRPATAALGAGAVTWAVIYTMPETWLHMQIHVRHHTFDLHNAIRLLVEAIVYVLAYFAAWRILPDGWSTLMSTLGALKELKPGKRSSSKPAPTTVAVGAVA
jgi:O-antigen/teichoic acid export membrane protein